MNINDFSSVAEIDLNSIEYNYRQLKSQIPNECEICCVIKSNAYGHGAVVLAKFYEYLGVKFFAVANVREGLELRKNGIKSSILILGKTNTCNAKVLAKNNLIQTIYSGEYAKSLSKQAKENKVKVKTHIKLDTGMNRLGFQVAQNNKKQDQLLDVFTLDNLNIEGVYTHLSIADEGRVGQEYTLFQIKKFIETKKCLEKRFNYPKITHCLNSAGILDYSEFSFDMVRPGICLYGYSPSDKIENKLNFIPAMTFKSFISQIKHIKAGDSVGYGRTFIAEESMTIAIVSVGYADGYTRSNASLSKVLVKGKLTKIVGRICMDQLMIDVTNLAVSEGDEVILFGKSPALTAKDIANNTNTICYEVLCAVSRRVPRIYKYNGKIVFTQNYLDSEKENKEEENEVDRII